MLELAVAATGDINLQDSVLAFQEEMRLDKVRETHVARNACGISSMDSMLEFLFLLH